jgi:type VI secretion system protein ImpF
MGSIDKKKKLKMPVLDCLLDDSPESTSESAQSANMLLDTLKESVRRDLESVFNTRQCCISPPAELPTLSASLLNYGLPDLATINLESSAAVQDFCSQVEATIANFEPRIKSVKVHSSQGLDANDKCFRFRVEAVLHASPSHETIIFDSSLDPVSQSVMLRESER